MRDTTRMSRTCVGNKTIQAAKEQNVLVQFAHQRKYDQWEGGDGRVRGGGHTEERGGRESLSYPALGMPGVAGGTPAGDSGEMFPE